MLRVPFFQRDYRMVRGRTIGLRRGAFVSEGRRFALPTLQAFITPRLHGASRNMLKVRPRTFNGTIEL